MVRTLDWHHPAATTTRSARRWLCDHWLASANSMPSSHSLVPTNACSPISGHPAIALLSHRTVPEDNRCLECHHSCETCQSVKTTDGICKVRGAIVWHTRFLLLHSFPTVVWATQVFLRASHHLLYHCPTLATRHCCSLPPPPRLNLLLFHSLTPATLFDRAGRRLLDMSCGTASCPHVCLWDRAVHSRPLPRWNAGPRRPKGKRCVCCGSKGGCLCQFSGCTAPMHTLCCHASTCRPICLLTNSIQFFDRRLRRVIHIVLLT